VPQESLNLQDTLIHDGMSYLPSRLIDVGDNLGTQDPRLVFTAEALNSKFTKDTRYRYIALSYCWGSPLISQPPLSTKRDTLRARCERIPIESMPQAFRDVVEVARKLGLQYVWIDSLCIIQDDIMDWQAESAEMKEIYGNAYLTVVAAARPSCHDGFLSRKPPRLSCRIPYLSTKTPLVNGSYYLRSRSGTKWWGTDKMAEISGTRWISRGWTFQEERLSVRVLMFGKTKFFFDCQSLERVENTEYSQRRAGWSSAIDRNSSEAILRGKPSPYDHWETLCNHYSRRRLTYPQDKLPALSGMASKISLKVRDVYLAGIWKRHLMHDLFWQIAENARASPDYRAPSWSWAAYDGEVRWPNWVRCSEDSCKTYCNIVDAQTATARIDPFGPVSDGWLTLSGKLVRVATEWAEGEEHTRYPLRVLFGNEEIARGDLDSIKHKSTIESPCKAAKEQQQWALLLAKCAWPKSRPHGLLLARTGRTKNAIDEFRRVGVFMVFLESRPSALTCWENCGPRTITII
jgi:hypothetical protein